ncbi:MAG: sodium:calcium antiporter [Carboxydocellales bacterium]
MMTVFELIAGLVIILAAAEFFTNGIEWLGLRLGLSEGAVGSVLAAVGTALPETMVPVLAIFFGHGEASTHVGIGAILGAPFMLSTLAFFVTGAAAVWFRRSNRVNGFWRNIQDLKLDRHVMLRDLSYFMVMYTIAIAASLVDAYSIKVLIAVALVVSYIVYVIRTCQHGECAVGDDLPSLYLAKGVKEPKLGVILFQVILALLGIVLGAKLFVGGVETAAAYLGIAPLILSLIIVPIATELPEKFNSIIWVRQGKDTLAMGNITGAMVFQSSIIPAIGITFTPWALSWLPVASAVLALTSAALVLITVYRTGRLKPQILMMGGLLYLVFIGLIFA